MGVPLLPSLVLALALALALAVALPAAWAWLRPPAVIWQDDLAAGLSQARRDGRPALLLFHADWCEGCGPLADAFAVRAVQRQARRFVTVRVDLTALDASARAVMQVYGVQGLPAVVFLDMAGAILPLPRVLGFVPADELASRLRAVPDE